MPEAMAGDEPATRRTLQKPALDQIRLDDVLDGVARLRQRGGQRLDADRAAAIVHRDGRKVTPVHGVETGAVDFERGQRLVGHGAIDRRGAGNGGKIANAAQQPSGDARRATRAPRDLVRAIRGHADAEHARATIDDLLELRLGIKVEPDRNAEAVTQRIGEEAGARRRADECELGEVDLHRARRRSRADNEIELKILHRRIKDFLDRRIETVNLVDEQYVAILEIGQERREIAGLGDHRTGRATEIDAELARQNLRQSGLAETRRTDEQHVIERFTPPARRFDEYAEIFSRLFLADEFRKALRPQRAFGGVLVAPLRRHQLVVRARFRARAHRSGPRLYLLGNSSAIGTIVGFLPLGTITRAFGS